MEARFDEKMAAAVSLESLRGIMKPVRAAQGPLVSAEVVEKTAASSSMTMVGVRMKWTHGDPMRMNVAFEKDGRVGGLRLLPDPGGSAADDAKYDGYETKARLVPPFKGTWTANNADRAASNPHYGIPAQRFAVDWLIVKDGKTLSDYRAAPPLPDRRQAAHERSA